MSTAPIIPSALPMAVKTWPKDPARFGNSTLNVML
jgi:hypothetical protein